MNLKFCSKYNNNLENGLRAQILLSTLLILTIISITVIAITATVTRNSRQVRNNIEYEKSYSYAETRLIQNASVLAGIASLTPTNLANALEVESGETVECTNNPTSSGGVVCTFEEADNRHRTVMVVNETNIVEDYQLGKDEYFDIILDNTFTGRIILNWVGESAFEFNLVYENRSNPSNTTIDTAVQIFDPINTYSLHVNSGQGITTDYVYNPEENRIEVGLSPVSVEPQIGISYSDIDLLYLRVKVINRESGTTVSIRPDVTSTNLPDQVRKVEAFSYDQELPESSVPIIISQFPLKPQTPGNLDFGVIANSYKSPVCGDGIISGNETCDDGNRDDNDSCNSTCRWSCDNVSANIAVQHTQETNPNTGQPFDQSIFISPIYSLCGNNPNDTEYVFSNFFADDFLFIVPAFIDTEAEFVVGTGGFVGDGSPSARTFYRNAIGVAPNSGFLSGRDTAYRRGGNANWCRFNNEYPNGAENCFLIMGYDFVNHTQPITYEMFQSIGAIGPNGDPQFRIIHIVAGTGTASFRLTAVQN